jgi:hypothetical protein
MHNLTNVFIGLWLCTLSRAFNIYSIRFMYFVFLNRFFIRKMREKKSAFFTHFALSHTFLQIARRSENKCVKKIVMVFLTNK